MFFQNRSQGPFLEGPVYFQAANLRVEVWDHDKDKDDFLGEVILSAEQLLGLGLNARKDLDLQKKAADKKKFKKGQIIQGSLGISVVEVVRMQLQIMGCKGLANTDEAENALIAKPAKMVVEILYKFVEHFVENCRKS